MLCPMHFPILLCGFVLGGPWGLAVGFAAPLLRSVLFAVSYTHLDVYKRQGLEKRAVPLVGRVWFGPAK